MLTSTQLTAISQYLKKSGIIYEEVHDELVDHFVNAIEVQMADQTSFDDALVDVGRQFGERRGLTHIQRKQIQASNRQYGRSLRRYFSTCLRWPNALFTLAVTWALYTLIDFAPNMMTVAYCLMVIAGIPFLAMLVLTGQHLWQFLRQKRQLAWSLDGFTLLSKSMGTAMMLVYPNLFVYWEMITPKRTPMSLGEQSVFFMLSCVISFLVYAQLNLIVRYAKSIDKTLTRLF